MEIPVKRINLADKLGTFSEHWQPRVVGQFNGNDLMVVKVKGEFVWHKHDDTDDFFLVLKGRIDIQMRNEIVPLGPGEMFVVPKGVEHRPVAVEEAHVLLIETQWHPKYWRPQDSGIPQIHLNAVAGRTTRRGIVDPLPPVVSDRFRPAHPATCENLER